MDTESPENMLVREKGPASERRVGTVVRELRAARKWSLQDLARRSGISAMQLSRIERLESSPTEEKIRSLANVFDVPVTMLFGDDPLDPALEALGVSLQAINARLNQARNQVRALQLLRRYGATNAREVAQRGAVRPRTITTDQGRVLVVEGESLRLAESPRPSGPEPT